MSAAIWALAFQEVPGTAQPRKLLLTPHLPPAGTIFSLRTTIACLSVRGSDYGIRPGPSFGVVQNAGATELTGMSGRPTGWVSPAYHLFLVLYGVMAVGAFSTLLDSSRSGPDLAKYAMGAPYR